MTAAGRRVIRRITVGLCVEDVERLTNWGSAVGGFLQLDSPVVQHHQARWNVAGEGREDDKLGRSPGLNLVRARVLLFVSLHMWKSSPSGNRQLTRPIIYRKLEGAPWFKLFLLMRLMILLEIMQ